MDDVDVILLKCSVCGFLVAEGKIEEHSATCVPVRQETSSLLLIDMDEIPANAPAVASAVPAAVVAESTLAASSNLANVSTASPAGEKKKKGFFSSIFGGESSVSAPASPSQQTAQPDPPQLARDYVKGAFVVSIVDQPMKTKLVTGMEAMTYRISAKSSMREYSEKPLMQCRRSFAEFQALHRHLVRLFPSCIVPPITDRKRMMTDDTSIAFITARARHLQRLLNRLGIHPTLCKAEPLRAFLQLEDKEWKDYLGKLDSEEKDILARAPKKGWFSGSAPAEFSKEEGATIASLRAFAVEAKEIETEFRNLSAWAKTLVAKRGEVGTTIATIGRDFDKISASKAITAPQSMIKNTQLVNCISSLMTTLSHVKESEEKIGESDTDGLYECLKEWAYYAKACQEWVARYEAIRNQHSVNLNALKKSPEDSNLAKAVVETEKQIKQIIDDSPEEIKQYDEFRIKEIVHWTRYYAKLQVEAHKHAIDTWEKYLKNFK